MDATSIPFQLAASVLDTIGDGAYRIAGRRLKSSPKRRLDLWSSTIRSALEVYDPELVTALGLERLLVGAPPDDTSESLVLPYYFNRDAFVGLTDPSISSANLLRRSLLTAFEVSPRLRGRTIEHVSDIASRMAPGLARNDDATNLIRLLTAFVDAEGIAGEPLQAPVNLVVQGASEHPELLDLVVTGREWMPERDRANTLIKLVRNRTIEPDVAISAAGTLSQRFEELVQKRLYTTIESRSSGEAMAEMTAPDAISSFSRDLWRSPLDDEDERSYVVNAGVVAADNPNSAKRGSLSPSSDYYVWLSIGEPDVMALQDEGDSIDLSYVRAGEFIDVVFFPDGEFLFDSAASTGALQMSDAGVMAVVRSASDPPVYGTPWDQRLCLAIRTPSDSGVFAIRIAMYFRQVLLQVVQMIVPVGEVDRRLARRTTYKILESPTPDRVHGIRNHRLSLFVNDQIDGTHGLYFHGRIDEEASFDASATMTAFELQRVTTNLRNELRRISWGNSDEEPSTSGYRYTYDPDRDHYGSNDPKQLESDLIALARRGFDAWSAIIDSFHLNQRMPIDQKITLAEEFQELMKLSGTLELAPWIAAEEVIPLSLIYDWTIDIEIDLSFCSAAREALREAGKSSGRKLAQAPCFRGECPSFGQDSIVCPGGFWGFRHAISTSPSVERSDLDGRIPSPYPPTALTAYTTDPAIGDLAEHQTQLAAYLSVVAEATSRASLKEELPRFAGQVFYLLCHGREDPGQLGALLVVGSPDGPGFGQSNLTGWKVNLTGYPLVFMNACQSAALSPEKAVSLVAKFQRAGASSAVGTEIAVFPSLAKQVALEFLEDFAGPSRIRLASALRNARLSLLAHGNPLALAYVAYGPSDTQLEVA